jgi:hypothetical protein
MDLGIGFLGSSRTSGQPEKILRKTSQLDFKRFQSLIFVAQ